MKHGADHRTTDSEGRTPFTSACNRLNCALIDLLLSRDPTLINTVVNKRGNAAEVCLERGIERLKLVEEDYETEYFLGEWRGGRGC